MKRISTIIRFAIKAAIAGTAVYYVKEEGVWGDSEQSVKVLDKLRGQLRPHLDQAKSVIPYELPKLPDNIEWQQCWNHGVTTTFTFLAELPDKTTKLVKDSYNSLLQNPDVKKLLESEQESDGSKK